MGSGLFELMSGLVGNVVRAKRQQQATVDQRFQREALAMTAVMDNPNMPLWVKDQARQNYFDALSPHTLKEAKAALEQMNDLLKQALPFQSLAAQAGGQQPLQPDRQSGLGFQTPQNINYLPLSTLAGTPQQAQLTRRVLSGPQAGQTIAYPPRSAAAQAPARHSWPLRALAGLERVGGAVGGGMEEALTGAPARDIGRTLPSVPSPEIFLSPEQKAAQLEKRKYELGAPLREEQAQEEQTTLEANQKRWAQEAEQIFGPEPSDAKTYYSHTGKFPARFGETPAAGTPKLTKIRRKDGSVIQVYYDPKSHTATNVAGRAVPLTADDAPVDEPKQTSANEFNQLAFQAKANRVGKMIDELSPQERIDAIREAKASPPPAPILPGTPQFRAAQDLAYGKLTFQQFRGLYGYSRNVADKLAIYNKARELNPGFDAAEFERGYKFASTPKTQQQLSALDNVMAGFPDLLKFSDEAQRSGAPILNQFVLPGGFKIGATGYSNFRLARIAMADELSGALGFGGATDMAKQMGFDMTDPNLSPEDFRKGMAEVVAPFVERKRDSLLNRMGPYGEAGKRQGLLPSPPRPGAEASIDVLKQALAIYGSAADARQALEDAGWKIPAQLPPEKK